MHHQCTMGSAAASRKADSEQRVDHPLFTHPPSKPNSLEEEASVQTTSTNQGHQTRPCAATASAGDEQLLLQPADTSTGTYTTTGRSAETAWWGGLGWPSTSPQGSLQPPTPECGTSGPTMGQGGKKMARNMWRVFTKQGVHGGGCPLIVKQSPTKAHACSVRSLGLLSEQLVGFEGHKLRAGVALGGGRSLATPTGDIPLGGYEPGSPTPAPAQGLTHPAGDLNNSTETVKTS